jgi:DHA1 family bicyclomycin/chloramphenicol resistance-like MFS transporter
LELDRSLEAASAAGGIPRTASFWRVFLMVAGLTVFGSLSIDAYLPAWPELSADFHASASEVGLTLTTFFLGFATGHLVIGPVSDILGRRRPLLTAIAFYVVVSLACALAPDVEGLMALRFLQGLFGSAGIVLARAVIRDHYSGVRAARLLSLLLIVGGTMPILAPVLGGQILRFSSWRGIFVMLAVITSAMWLKTYLSLRESLPPERRHGGGFRALPPAARILVRDRAFVGYAVAFGFNQGAVFAYVAGSTFVLQEIYGLSPQQFSAVFAANAGCQILLAQINVVLIGRFPLRRMVGIGNAIALVGALSLLAVVLKGGLGLAAFLPCLALVFTPMGFIGANSMALAMTDHPQIAGTASAFIGVIGFTLGSVAAPLVGIAGEHSALPLVIVIAFFQTTSFCAFRILTRPPRPAQVAEAVPEPHVGQACISPTCSGGLAG